MSRRTETGHRLSPSMENINGIGANIGNESTGTSSHRLHDERHKDRMGLDTRNTNTALLHSLESMRNVHHVAQQTFNLEYSDERDIINNYGSSLMQQYLQHQHRQNITEQNLLSERFEQLRQLHPLPSHELPSSNQQLGTNLYNFTPSLSVHMNAITPHILPLQISNNPVHHENLLDMVLARSMNRPFLRQNNQLGSALLAIMNSLDRPGILSDPSLQYVQQFHQPEEIITSTVDTAMEQYATAVATSRNDTGSTSNDLSDSVGLDKNEEPPPIRALSAYNFFFRYERERILNSQGDLDDVDLDVSETNQEVMLRMHWNRDRTVKRRHRKSHGKISFAELSRKISQRWHKLPEHQRNFFNEVAAKDWDRYHREMEQLKQRKQDP